MHQPYSKCCVRLRLETWDRLRAKRQVTSSEQSRSVHSVPALASNTSGSTSMSSLMLDLLSRTSAVTLNTANTMSSTDAVADVARPSTVSQGPLPTVTVSSSNDVSLSTAVLQHSSHRAMRQHRESILHYLPPLTGSRDEQARPLADSRFVCLFFIVRQTFFLLLLFICCSISVRVRRLLRGHTNRIDKA